MTGKQVVAGAATAVMFVFTFMCNVPAEKLATPWLVLLCVGTAGFLLGSSSLNGVEK